MHFVDLLKVYCEDTQFKERAYGKDFDYFSVDSGVKRSGVLSFVLFNYVADWNIERVVMKHEGVVARRGVQLTDLDYVDDVAFADMIH